jgi:hypothetical protein
MITNTAQYKVVNERRYKGNSKVVLVVNQAPHNADIQGTVVTALHILNLSIRWNNILPLRKKSWYSEQKFA